MGQKINAILLDQFKAGPGHDKVSYGEYELFNSIDAKQPLSDSELGMLIPGMSITMAFVIGIYEQQPLKKCPRPGCQTRQFSTLPSGGRRWYSILLSRIYNIESDLDSATCGVWFDISRTKLPRPFRFSAAEDVFKQIRAERKWFKNVRLFPSELPSLPLKVDESGHVEKSAGPKSDLSVPVAKKENTAHLVTHPSPYRELESLPSFPRIEIPQELATKAIEAIAYVCGVTVDELRGICSTSGPDFIDSLGLDSLSSIELIFTLTDIGVEIPRSATGGYLVQEVFEGFLGSFILQLTESGHEVDCL